MTTPVLAASGLGKAFGGVKAVDGVSLALSRGEMVALIGPNGAGKSTCFNVLGGQLRADSGRVVLEGRDVTGRTPRRLARLGVGRTFQVAETFASMTVRENVQLALLGHNAQIWRFLRPTRSFLATEADRLLARLGLANEAETQAGALAYGDNKRLELALALAGDPILLLMDEPTAGMALDERAELMRFVRELASEQGLGVLFTEHDMDVVFGTADRVLVLDRGRLIAEGDPDAIRSNETVRAVYLGVDAGS